MPLHRRLNLQEHASSPSRTIPYSLSGGNASSYMELSLEAYRLIVKYIGNRTDICVICRVSRGFQYVAERALYNTIYVRDTRTAGLLCNTLSTQPRLSDLVEAFTISFSEEESGEEEEEGEENSPTDDLWPSVSRTLQNTTRLRFLNIHANNGSNPPTARILQDTAFRLRSFHCDMEWNHDLITFLNNQPDLIDLYIVDFNESPDVDTSTVPSVTRPSLNTQSLPNLSTLECTFTEAVGALVPGRPVTRLKTCFSRTDLVEKRAEMTSLLEKIQQSSRSLRSLDVADSSYSEAFSMELLTSVINALHRHDELRYLGTLVLPIGGRQRLRFYGLLMRLTHLQCIEVEVTEWDPPPLTPAALRALTTELRLYCSSVQCVVFVHDFDRMVMRVINGICLMDNDANTENLWREI